MGRSALCFSDMSCKPLSLIGVPASKKNLHVLFGPFFPPSHLTFSPFLTIYQKVLEIERGSFLRTRLCLFGPCFPSPSHSTLSVHARFPPLHPAIRTVHYLGKCTATSFPFGGQQHFVPMLKDYSLPETCA